MPGMTGIELIELLHDTGQSLPTVILTSIVDERAHARSAALGAHAWLTKPVTDERLLAALASAIHTQLPHSDFKRSEERRVGKACVSTGRSRWSPDHKKK